MRLIQTLLINNTNNNRFILVHIVHIYNTIYYIYSYILFYLFILFLLQPVTLSVSQTNGITFKGEGYNKGAELNGKAGPERYSGAGSASVVVKVHDLRLTMKFVCGQCWSVGLPSEPDKALKYCSAKARHRCARMRAHRSMSCYFLYSVFFFKLHYLSVAGLKNGGCSW